jgi:serine/threonine protein kinase
MASAQPRLGGYLLERRLAGGGTAELLLARREGGPPVVIKRLLPQYQADPEHARMFLNEARLSLRFDHPHIVRTYELGTDPATGQPFMVMEHLDGPDLRTLLRTVLERGHRVSAGVAAELMLQTLDGLGYAHGLMDADGRPLSIVHRDVSLANVVVTTDGVAKLIDFGIVRAQINEGDTRTGELKGSVAYMSPEQIGGRALDGRADLFAVGVCLYELVTGVHPFRRSHELATFNAILDEQPAPLSKWGRADVAEVEEVIRGALAKRSDGRYPSAAVMRQALQAVPDVADRATVAALVRTVYTSPFEPESLPSWAVDGETETVLPRAPERSTAATLPVHDVNFDGHTVVDTTRSSGEHDTAMGPQVPLPDALFGLEATLPPPAPRGAGPRRGLVVAAPARVRRRHAGRDAAAARPVARRDRRAAARCDRHHRADAAPRPARAARASAAHARASPPAARAAVGAPPRAARAADRGVVGGAVRAVDGAAGQPAARHAQRSLRGARFRRLLEALAASRRGA